MQALNLTAHDMRQRLQNVNLLSNNNSTYLKHGNNIIAHIFMPNNNVYIYNTNTSQWDNTLLISHNMVNSNDNYYITEYPIQLKINSVARFTNVTGLTKEYFRRGTTYINEPGGDIYCTITRATAFTRYTWYRGRENTQAAIAAVLQKIVTPQTSYYLQLKERAKVLLLQDKLPRLTWLPGDNLTEQATLSYQIATPFKFYMYPNKTSQFAGFFLTISDLKANVPATILT